MARDSIAAGPIARDLTSRGALDRRSCGPFRFLCCRHRQSDTPSNSGVLAHPLFIPIAKWNPAAVSSIGGLSAVGTISAARTPTCRQPATSSATRRRSKVEPILTSAGQRFENALGAARRCPPECGIAVTPEAALLNKHRSPCRSAPVVLWGAPAPRGGGQEQARGSPPRAPGYADLAALIARRSSR
jgi:hypothetical protein